MSLTLANVAAVITATDQKGLVGGFTASDAIQLNQKQAFGIGVADKQVDVLWRDSRQLIATSEELDLAGVLADQFGRTKTFAKVKAIYIRNTAVGTGKVLTIGGAAANQFLTPFGAADDKLKIGPEGFLLLVSPTDGYVVTAATGDKLKIDSGASTITYDIVVLGTSS